MSMFTMQQVFSLGQNSNIVMASFVSMFEHMFIAEFMGTFRAHWLLIPWRGLETTALMFQSFQLIIKACHILCPF